MKRPVHLPLVLRSWQHLRDTVPGLKQVDLLPIQASGMTYTMAQEVTWLNGRHFAVGRWDGSLSIFQFTRTVSKGPLISKAVNTPSSEGVQMITLLKPGLFATSNDEQTAIVWKSDSGEWDDLERSQILGFSSDLGTANSGVSYSSQDGTAVYFVIGHANGFLSTWRSQGDAAFLQMHTTDVRAARPVNPWGLHNVRGIGLVDVDEDTGYVVTGSEDGDLCIVRVSDGTILSRTIYNPLATRGINSLAIEGGNLLIANCAVGLQDNNLWLYQIDKISWRIDCHGGARLVVDPTQAQAFNFDVIWGSYGGGRCWFAATEEGYLWMGHAKNNIEITIIGKQAVTAKLGAAIGMNDQSDLAFAAYDLYEFNTIASIQ